MTMLTCQRSRFTLPDGLHYLNCAFMAPLAHAVRDAGIDGIDRREAADAMQGTRLFVARDALPDTEEDEYYHADLIGLSARTASGETYGVVRGIYDYGAGDVIEIEREMDRPILFPFTRENVPEIDLAAGALVIDPPAEIEAGYAGDAEKR